jgi:hypothetical protein
MKMPKRSKNVVQYDSLKSMKSKFLSDQKPDKGQHWNQLIKYFEINYSNFH